MNIEVSHFGLVSDFIGVDFDSKKISFEWTQKLKRIFDENKLNFPIDWQLIFHLTYNNGKNPLVAKNKVGGYLSDKMKYVKIVIPVPLKSEISWGVNLEQHLYGKDHYDKFMRNFNELDINFENYKNRTDYITACLKAGIQKALKDGFTVGGVKIKVKGEIEF